MSTSDGRRPGCPGRQGTGTDIHTADFTLVVHDCETGPDGRPTATEVLGFYRLPGEEHDDDSLVTASIVVPAGSPVARMAHQVRRTAGSPARSTPSSAATSLAAPAPPEPGARP